MSIRGDERRATTAGSGDSTERDRAERNGVDYSLIEWMLSLSPAERVEVAQDWVAMVDRFGGADGAD